MKSYMYSPRMMKIVLGFFEIHICIKKTFKKSLVEKVVKNFIPNTGGLLQSIRE